MVFAQFCRCYEVWRKKRTMMESQEGWKWHSPSLLIWPFPRSWTVRFLKWFKQSFPRTTDWATTCFPWLQSEKIMYLVVKTMKLFLVIAVLYVPLLVHMVNIGFHFSLRMWFGASFSFTMHWPRFGISLMICVTQVFICL